LDRNSLTRRRLLWPKILLRQAVVQQGIGTAMVLIAGMMLGMLAAVARLVLMIMGHPALAERQAAPDARKEQS
jgi:hypothetical protein